MAKQKELAQLPEHLIFEDISFGRKLNFLFFLLGGGGKLCIGLWHPRSAPKEGHTAPPIA